MNADERHILTMKSCTRQASPDLSSARAVLFGHTHICGIVGVEREREREREREKRALVLRNQTGSQQ